MESRHGKPRKLSQVTTILDTIVEAPEQIGLEDMEHDEKVKRATRQPLMLGTQKYEHTVRDMLSHIKK